eukprot:CAMPEP_0172573974 /NCGR_PEP_ID=MMETSP1067-20121228/136467_1 /TAXON_ID=265564 ORGANISM="Thalassiosira punctigera, Strain Tpunct2005C2" /NCGR_SAMPLE_ID=MMETSP1067 /ASSEMBLY_ACC=CAM_ASM_000444 /LENGTH=618 /DNA_ID=CAMNT_0013366597 /DNA_START=32 /DNA_END=1888 /DNA_ORIENTATION=-
MKFINAIALFAAAHSSAAAAIKARSDPQAKDENAAATVLRRREKDLVATKFDDVALRASASIAHSGSRADTATVVVALREASDDGDSREALEDACGDLAASVGGSVKRVLREALGGCSIVLPRTAIDALRRNDGVRHVEEVRDVPASNLQDHRNNMRLANTPPSAFVSTSTPNPAPTPPPNGESASISQVPWNLDRINQCRLPLDDATEKVDAGGVRIYILGTGIDGSHNEFDGTLERDTSSNSYCHSDQTEGGESPLTDWNGYSTRVADIACGATYGVAKNCKLCSVKIMNESGWDTIEIFENGIDFAVENCATVGAKCVINISMHTSSFNADVNEAVLRAVNMGIVVVVEAANWNNANCDLSPASSGNAITVGATDRTDGRWGYSNYGSCVNVYAPGTDIVTAVMGPASGTGYASPHVAAIAAGILAAYPTLTPQQVKNKIIDDASIIGTDPTGFEMRLANTAGDCNRPTPPPNAMGQTPTTSPAPTPPPTSELQCGTGEVKFELEISNDDFPEGTTWVLYSRDANGEYYDGGPGLDNYTSELFCILGGRYSFEIDHFGEFIGTYTIKANGNLVGSSEGGFESYEETDFVCDDVECCVTTQSSAAANSYGLVGQKD